MLRLNAMFQKHDKYKIPPKNKVGHDLQHKTLYNKKVKKENKGANTAYREYDDDVTKDK